MAHLCLIVGIYDNNPALFSLLLRLHGYRIHGQIDYHALSTKKAGYGEPKQVVDINEDILALNASRWFDPIPPPQITTWHVSDEVHQQMQSHLDTMSGNAIIDDPRLCYTLPFWQSAITRSGHDSTVVVPYQHPFTVAHRMHHQYHMSTRLALALWAAYMLAIATHTHTYRRVFMNVDEVMHDWQGACKPIIDQIAPDGLSDVVITQIDAYVHMRQHSTSAKPHISAQIQALAIAQIAEEVYTAVQQPSIDATTITSLNQRLEVEIADLQYAHDVGQYDVIFNDIYLDPAARINALTQAMHQQHREFSNKIQLLHEEHSQKRIEIYEKHGKYIEHQSRMFAETLTKHEEQLGHMRATFEQEIQHLNDKIATMQTEIDWRTQVAQQQQNTLSRLGWAMRILALIDRITKIGRTS